MNLKSTRRVFVNGLSGVCLAALLLVTTVRPVSAQVLYGSVVGTVSDPSGAVIPGATVTLTSKQIGVSRTDKTDDGGRYSFVNVLPGNYDVAVSATGFRTFLAQGVGRNAEYHSPYRFQARSRPDHRSGDGRSQRGRAANREGRHAFGDQQRGHHQHADRRLSQLSDADQPGARRIAGRRYRTRSRILPAARSARTSTAATRRPTSRALTAPPA